MVAPMSHGIPSALTSPGRLQKIDQLREKNVGKHLPLPQLVVVGDQSSGKSSLLETLTGIPFPRGQELCTRYATQISHRRDDLESINISIIPGPQATPAEKSRLEEYRKSVRSTTDLHVQFEAILDEVNIHMGVKTGKNQKGDKTFSEDVLKIEKCGPDEDYLTVIDVPGIFRKITEGVTTERDKELVSNMVKGYIRDDRTIILAVLPSNVDVTTQEILALAEQYDRTGERTLGVLTKPDLVTEHSAKAVVCSLVEGKRHPLNLGYYVVRNRGGDDKGFDGSNTQRREDLFKEEPWCRLPPDRVGVSALRGRLQELLGHITDRAFPKLRIETRQMLAEAQQELDELGQSRQTEREQQQYLATIASTFQNMARAALDADYSAHPALANDELRLITSIINITDRFNSDFVSSSHTRCFQSIKRSESDSVSEAEESTCDVGSDEDDDVGNLQLQGEDLYEFQVPDPKDYPELGRIVTTEHTSESPAENVMEWIENIYRRSRGAELGTFGPGLLSSTFREQSKKWDSMTQIYISKVITIIHRFIMSALGEICIDSRVREELISTIMTDLLARYEVGMKQGMFLVDVERDRKPYTLNHYFSSHLQQSRSLRVTENFRSLAKDKDTDVGKRNVIELDRIQSAVNDKTYTEHVKEDIHDILEAYYKIAH
ncbi:interferon-induced GTP-binding protein Mx2 [Purpureocillium lilacinum]|uniref:Interferon-induced GTP-binding protein Mx2 n=1 Tax=Purpureocillium lilacinum TaxID=33203 RepID=A0A179GDR2_PURLI|nr:interferon-induced GTP-binding protein Mx2 [Purpureocillium lilacinum]OAQ75964.1 interferon-induced GTP-binding protein Mx2 [Purpureocillium lilacinum]